MTNIITTIATKGGTGKTTTAYWLSCLLIDFGYSVLVIDTDPQASCSLIYDVTETAQHGITELLARGGKDVDSTFISKTSLNVDLIISDFAVKEGGSALFDFNQRGDHAFVMRRAVQSPTLATYDFIIIDTQGAAGGLQRSAALASTVLLSPFAPTLMDVGEFITGTKPMIQDLNTMSDFGVTAPPIFAFANNMPQTVVAKAILSNVREAFAIDPNVRILNTVIRTNTNFQKALTLKVAPHSLDKTVSETLHNLLWEIYPNMSGKNCSDWQRELKTSKVGAK